MMGHACVVRGRGLGYVVVEIGERAQWWRVLAYGCRPEEFEALQRGGCGPGALSERDTGD